MGLQSIVTWRLKGSSHKTNTVHFEEGFKQISSAIVEHHFDLVVAVVFPESFIVKVAFINFASTSFVTEHKFLEGHEAQVP